MWDSDGARCPSPPLEGGEALCDFYGVERLESGDQLANRSREIVDYVATELQANGGTGPVLDSSGDGAILSQLLSANTFTQTFLQGILSSVESRDPVVASAWMETLLDVIDLLPKEILKRDILTLAVSKGQLSQPLSSRLLCCKILGKISTKFEPYIIRKEVVPLVQCLCQDTDHEVRGEMCRQLDAVARGIGLEATRSAILPELVELGNDEEETVQLVAIETVVRMLPMLDDDTCNQTIIPLVKKLCERSFRSKGITLPGVSQQLGRFCHGLSPSLARDHGHWFITFFKKLAVVGNCKDEQTKNDGIPDVVPNTMSPIDRHTLCRQACAYNFPAMVLFCGTPSFQLELSSTYLSLCNDPDSSVRRSIACSFHQVAKLLAEDNRNDQDSSQLLLPVLNILMKDSKTEVLKGLMPNLTESLERVTTGLKKHEGCEVQLAELLHSLVVCEVTTAHASNWRLHADLLTCISCLPKCLTSDKVQPSFLPLLLHKMHSARPIPCRLSAAYSLLIFLKYTPSSIARQEIIHTLVQEFCLNSSCHKRMLFLRICDLAIEIFSKSFFKGNFFKPLLSLAGDKVPNIRLRLCCCLTKLKSLLLMPKDSNLLQRLEACVKRLMIDEKDKDVVAAVRKAIQELDDIEVALDPATARRSSCNLDVVVDLEDIRKSEEEKKLWENDPNKHNNSPKVMLRKPRAIPIKSGYSTHSWERPKRQSLIETSPNLPKSSTIPRRRSTLIPDPDQQSKNRLSISLPSSPRESRKCPTEIIVASKIPRAHQMTPSRPVSPHPAKNNVLSPCQSPSRIPTRKSSLRRQSQVEDSNV